MRPLVPLVLVLLTALDATAGARVVLVDGKEIAARSVERRGDLYVVHLEGGPTLTMPLDLVEGVHLSAGEEAGPLPGSTVQVVLGNGSVLTGVSLDRKEGLYELRMASGETLTIPTDLVRQIRFSAGEAPPPGQMNRAAPSRDEPPPAPEAPPGPAGEGTRDRPQPREAPPRPPTRAEQLGVFLEPSALPQPPAAIWEPRDSLGPETDVMAFEPAGWQGSAHDPAWSPTSSWSAPSLLPDFNTARWSAPPRDPAWSPRGGWVPAASE